jgi:hypothetical protein
VADNNSDNYRIRSYRDYHPAFLGFLKQAEEQCLFRVCKYYLRDWLPYNNDTDRLGSVVFGEALMRRVR